LDVVCGRQRARIGRERLGERRSGRAPPCERTVISTYGCDQFEADLLCKLTAGDPSSTATSFDLAYTIAAPGFACPNFGVDMGALPELGVNQTVLYQDFNLAQTHGNGVVVVNPTYT